MTAETSQCSEVEDVGVEGGAHNGLMKSKLHIVETPAAAEETD